MPKLRVRFNKIIDEFSKPTCRNLFGQVLAYIDDFKRFFVGWTSGLEGHLVQIGMQSRNRASLTLFII
ncbi:hypothetical protein BH10ACI1_BH10ACI1_00500 [soil metagenome]